MRIIQIIRNKQRSGTKVVSKGHPGPLSTGGERFQGDGASFTTGSIEMPERLACAGVGTVFTQIGVDVVHGGFDAIHEIAYVVEAGLGHEDLIGLQPVSRCQSAGLVGALAMATPTVSRRPPGTGGDSEAPTTPLAPLLSGTVAFG